MNARTESTTLPATDLRVEDVDESLHLRIEQRGRAGLITLARPRALNALSLGMVRGITRALRMWREDAAVEVVAIRGTGREGPFGTFCAGGDIRFFHRAVLTGDPRLDDFFTEEYTLNHLIHHYPKPYVSFLDGVVMGGGMGLSQGGGQVDRLGGQAERTAARLRIVTERTKMAMPETAIGLFPDVGGGWFLARCPGHVGEWLGLSGATIDATDAIAFGLADCMLPSASLSSLWDELAQTGAVALTNASQMNAIDTIAVDGRVSWAGSQIDPIFGLSSVSAIVSALESDHSAWAVETAASLRRVSPLALHLSLELIRRGRTLPLADELRLERDLVRNAFVIRPGTAGETVEGIRALAIDKDHRPAWNPSRIEDVEPAMWAPYFESPWPRDAHPLAHLR